MVIMSGMDINYFLTVSGFRYELWTFFYAQHCMTYTSVYCIVRNVSLFYAYIMRWFITGFLLILLCPSSRMKQKSQMCLSFLEHLEKCSLEAYSLLLLPTSLALILLQIQLAYILYHQIQNLCQRFSCTAFFQPPLLIFLQIRFFLAFLNTTVTLYA